MFKRKKRTTKKDWGQVRQTGEALKRAIDTGTLDGAEVAARLEAWTRDLDALTTRVVPEDAEAEGRE